MAKELQIMKSDQNNTDEILDAYLKSISAIEESLDRFHDISRTLGDNISWVCTIEKTDEKILATIFRLIGRELLRPNLFPIALRAVESDTCQYISDRYLCKDVDYDNCLMGFTGTLMGYFSDIVEFKGAEYLIEFLKSDLVAKEKLKDQRVQKAILFSLPNLSKKELRAIISEKL